MSGKAFYGKSEDGSDAKEFEGVYINPNNPNEWSSNPYTKQFHKIEQFLPKVKEWICRGKHQYKNINGEWICQCGIKL